MVIKKNIIFLCFSLVVGVLYTSCSNFENWEPEGKIVILQLGETVLSDVRSATIDFQIKNIGKSSISGYTLSLCCDTDQRTYYYTINLDCYIPSGKSIYHSFSFDYSTVTEFSSKEKVRIDSVYFK